MFGFGRKKQAEGVAQTFVEATGGGWNDTPDVIALDGGKHAGYVEETLRQACNYARKNGVEVGDRFVYQITDIPRGISSPHEITVPLMMQADKYGLSTTAIYGEIVEFTRLR